MSLERHVRQRIRAKRRELNIKQCEVANALGVSRQAWTKTENGEIALHLDTLYAVAAYLGCYYLDLIAGYVPPGSPQPPQEVRQLDLTQPDNMLS